MSVPTPYSECSTAACARLTPVDAAVNVTTAATPTARPTATITTWRTRPRRPRSRYVTKNLPEDFASAESGPLVSRAVMTRTQAAGAGSPTDPWVPAADRSQGTSLRLPPVVRCPSRSRPHQLEDRALGRFYGEGGNTGSTWAVDAVLPGPVHS